MTEIQPKEMFKHIVEQYSLRSESEPKQAGMQKASLTRPQLEAIIGEVPASSKFLAGPLLAKPAFENYLLIYAAPNCVISPAAHEHRGAMLYGLAGIATVEVQTVEQALYLGALVLVGQGNTHSITSGTDGCLFVAASPYVSKLS